MIEQTIIQLLTQEEREEIIRESIEVLEESEKGFWNVKTGGLYGKEDFCEMTEIPANGKREAFENCVLIMLEDGVLENETIEVLK